MERADWLEERVNSADARFLMVTAITHHRFSSPIWGAREVRKLQAELADIAKHAADCVTVAGTPAELTLWSMGRASAANVTFEGPDDAVTRLRAWRR